MWPRTRLLELLAIDHPILQAPMAGATTPRLAAAVSNAGGLGGFGAAGTPVDDFRQVVREIRYHTDRPFQVNLFSPNWGEYLSDADREKALREGLEQVHNEAGLARVPEPIPLFGRFDDKLDIALEERVPVISLHFGTVSRERIDALHERGIRVIGTATTPEEARLLERSGMDAVIAQGLEAGGHQGTFDRPLESRLGTLALVPAVVDVVAVPVIAAGGIADARGIVAALALGACGVQMGTVFLTCEENDVVHTAWRRALLESDGTDTVMTSAISGRPARALRSPLVELTESLAEHRLPYPWHYSATRDLRRASARGDGRYLAMWAGQGVGLIEETSATDLVAHLAVDSLRLLRSLAPETS